MTNALTGTTAPIFIARSDNPQLIRPGKNYFLIQIHNAQAAYFGPPWQKTEGLAVTSQVDLSHQALGGAIKAIHRIRKVERNRAEQLGLSPNLVGLVPATMTHVSVSIDFILDRKNQLVALSKVINSDGLLSTLSLAPGAALVAQTLSRLAQQLIENFIPAADSVPLLQFGGDFNLAGEGLKEGYYAILGSRDDANPLPTPYTKLSVRDRVLLANDLPVTQLSYVLLNVQCVPARTRDMNDNAAWAPKLREAEDEAQSLLNDPLASAEAYAQGWKKCQTLLHEAQALLRNDPNYLPGEANQIIQAAYKKCEALVKQKAVDTRDGGLVKAARAWTVDSRPDRDLLGIPQDDGELDKALDEYAEQVFAARRALKAAGLR
jgi:hypothetical protein